MDEWESQGQYEEKFRLRLTAKHALVVGRWEADDQWGVDLRRWSYDRGRLLGMGVTLNADAWQWLCGIISDLHDAGAFARYGSFERESYEFTFSMNKGYSLVTCLFDESQTPYFCLGLRRHEEVVWRARGTPMGIIIRFDTIPDFLVKSQEHALARKREKPKNKRKIDRGTGKEIF